MQAYGMTRNRAFSLIELVIVVVIIGIIGAIAIPRMSRGAAGANDSAVRGNLAVLRSAIDLYSTEHDGKFPPAADIVDLLTKYSNADGSETDTAKDVPNGVIFGPYIREIPSLPVGPEKGSTTIAAAAGAGVGWVYDETSGKIIPNTGTETDTRGVLYTSY